MIRYNKNTILQAVYFVTMALLLAVISLINFVEFSFEVERLYNPTFWSQYIITLTVGIAVFFLVLLSSNLRNKTTQSIKTLLDELSQLFNLITSTDGLYKKFKDYLEKLNNERKLKLYITQLKQKRERAKNQAEVEKIDKQLETAHADFEYKDIKFNRKTVNLIFAGFRTQDDDEHLRFTGRENMAEFLLPAVLTGIIITVLTLAFTMTGSDSTLDKIIQLVTRLATIGSYASKGVAYSDYLINTVYKSALENRKGVVQCFLDEVGYSVAKEKTE